MRIGRIFPLFLLSRTPATPAAPATHTLTLRGRQTRVIDAHTGLHLQVMRGRVWLTEPGAVQDLFLPAGAGVNLRQSWVVVQADAMPDQKFDAQAVCVLSPLPPGDESHWRCALWRLAGR